MSRPQSNEISYLHLLAGETGQRRRGPNVYLDKDSPFTKCQRPFRRADERIEVRATSCPSWKTILEV